MHNYIITVYITTVSLCNQYCYMFRQFRCIIRQFTTKALLSYTRSSNCSCWKYKDIRNDCRGFNNLPPRSPDATPCDFFLWSYVKYQVYVPPLPASIPELKVRIRTDSETITADRLQTVWNELDYRVDVCRITKGAHIEHL